DAGRLQRLHGDRHVVREVAVVTGSGDGDGELLAVLGEDARTVLRVAVRLQDRSGLRRVAVRVHVLALELRGKPRVERRLGDAGDVEDRVLQAGLTLGGHQVAVDGHVDCLPDLQVGRRAGLQVRVQGTGGVQAFVPAVVRRVLVEEVRLEVRDVVTRPVDLLAEERRLGRGVR